MCCAEDGVVYAVGANGLVSPGQNDVFKAARRPAEAGGLTAPMQVLERKPVPIVVWPGARPRGPNVCSESRGIYHCGMGYYTGRDHPFYTWLFRTVATSDRYPVARLGNTALNRA